MMHFSLKIAAWFALAATWPCPAPAVDKSPKLARCDGKARRPANLYGSILPSVDPAAGTLTPPPAVKAMDVFPPSPPVDRRSRGSATPPDAAEPATQVPPIGALEPPQSFRSC